MPDCDLPLSSQQTSTAAPGLVRLIANSADASTEIFILDGKLNRIAQGLGRLQLDVFPGMYKIKFKAGTAIYEVHRAVRADETQVSVEATANLLRFDSAAPLTETSMTHEYHQSHASRISGTVQQHLGNGGQMFLFVRDFTPTQSVGTNRLPPTDNPATGLTLHDSNGFLLVNIEQVAERSTSDPDRWAGFSVELNPGCYLLRVDAGELGGFEQTVVVCRGWQTQVFLLRRAFDKQQLVYRADLPTASVLMARLGQLNNPFEPWRASLRLTELAREGLATGRPVISEQTLRAAVADESVRVNISQQTLLEMLDRKFDNPMLGILGAHLLITVPGKEDVLRQVLTNLHLLIGDDHPDVAALDIWLNAPETNQQTFNTPPMLRSSWEILLNLSRDRYDLFPQNSLSTQIASDLWGSSAWLVWRKNPEPRVGATSVRQINPGQNTTDTSLLSTVVRDEPLPPVEEVARLLGLGPLASVLLGLLLPRRLTFQISSRGMELLFPDRNGNRQILRDSELVRTLGVPRSGAAAALVELAAKLDRRVDKPERAPEPNTRYLFDGSITTFKEWRFVGEGAFALVDGTLEAQPGRDFGVLYYSGEKFNNYVLRLQFRLSRRSDDSGIFVRFRDPFQPVPDRQDPTRRHPYQKKQWVAVHTGFEVQIDERARGEPAGLDQHRTGAVYDVPIGLGPMQQFYSRGPELKPGMWNDCEIEVIENSYRITINNLLATTFQNNDNWRGLQPTIEPASGYIGIQCFIGNIRFRNIRLQPV